MRGIRDAVGVGGDGDSLFTRASEALPLSAVIGGSEDDDALFTEVSVTGVSEALGLSVAISPCRGSKSSRW